MQGFTRENQIAGILKPRTPLTSAQYEHNATVSARGGVSISGGNGTKSDWTEIIAATGADAYGVWIKIAEGANNTTTRRYFLDVGVGTLGNEAVIIPDICGTMSGTELVSSGFDFGPRYQYIPGLFIPAGSRVCVRAQTNGVFSSVVSLVLDTQARFGVTEADAQTYGIVSAATASQSFNSGANAFSSWSQIGSGTVRAHNIWTLAIDCSTTANVASECVLSQIGFGPGINSVVVIGNFQHLTNGREVICGPFPLFAVQPVSSGALLWARAAATQARLMGHAITAI